MNNGDHNKIRRPSLLVVCMALLWPCLCQCQIGSAGRWVTLRPTDRVVVSYQQGSDGGLRQTLCGGSQFSAREAYSKKGADPGLKVAQLDDIQRLLDEFGRNRFFTKARPTAPADGKQLLSVEVNGVVFKPNFVIRTIAQDLLSLSAVRETTHNKQIKSDVALRATRLIMSVMCRKKRLALFNYDMCC